MSTHEMLAMVMASNWPPPLLMIFSFPLLLLLLLLSLHIVTELTPRSLRPHRVSVYPFKNGMTNLRLTLRLLPAALRATGDWIGIHGKLWVGRLFKLSAA